MEETKTVKFESEDSYIGVEIRRDNATGFWCVGIRKGTCEYPYCETSKLNDLRSEILDSLQQVNCAIDYIKENP